MASQDGAQLWPLGVLLPSVEQGPPLGFLQVRPGLTTLVGPNGSGKTRALRTIRSTLEGSNRIAIFDRKVHLLAAGRGSPLERFRAAVDRPGGFDSGPAAVGHADQLSQWHALESVTGILLALSQRADLRLKVEARLRQLFGRSVGLSWGQSGLSIQFVTTEGGGGYPANVEASGILQMVALLAAIHNDEIGALLVDEPEISLHPQHQAFLLEEMEQVAGDPSDRDRKLIVIATHSPQMLPLRRIGELPTVAFFNSVHRAPVQVSPDAEVLERKRLAALIARLGGTHRIAMFAERVLLVEGPSDEIILTQLARRLGLRLLARNAQILPVTGKGEFAEAAKLFALLEKQVAILADLDALADDPDLVQHFSQLPGALDVAGRRGHASLCKLDLELRSAVGAFMTKYGTAIEGSTATQPETPNDAQPSSPVRKRRETLIRLLSDPDSFGGEAALEASRLQSRFEALLTGLSELGCFFLRRGAIEDYYVASSMKSGKPGLAAEEAATFDERQAADLRNVYTDAVRALEHVAPDHRVDEDRLLRPKLGAVMASTCLSVSIDSSDGQLDAAAESAIGPDATIFRLRNRSKESLRVEIDIASPLFQRAGFPFEYDVDDNPINIALKKLPGKNRR